MGSLLLIILAVFNLDIMFLINDLNGNWYCNDDGGNVGFNLVISFYNLMFGMYDIWIGFYFVGGNVEVILLIFEFYSE